MRKLLGISHVLAVIVVLLALAGQTGFSQSNTPPNPGLTVLETDFGEIIATSTFSGDFLSITTVLQDKATGKILTSGTVTHRGGDMLIRWEVPGRFVNFYTSLPAGLSLELENYGIKFLWERYLDAGEIEKQQAAGAPEENLFTLMSSVPLPLPCLETCPEGPCPIRAGDGTCTISLDLTCETRQCCLSHDVCYCIGGTPSDRLQCDLMFFSCLVMANPNPKVSGLYFGGVRLFGDSWVSGGRNRWNSRPDPATCPPLTCATTFCCQHYCLWTDKYGRLEHNCEEICCDCQPCTKDECK